MSHLVFSIIAVFLSLAICRPNDVLADISLEVRQIFESAKPAIVRVEAKDQHGIIRGTGFYIDSLGTLYTLASITQDAEEIFVLEGNERIPAKLLVSDNRSGLAILRTDGNHAHLPIGTSSELTLASPVIVIGYPLDFDIAPSFGLISSFDRHYNNNYFSTTHMRINIPVQRGQGGSPVLNIKGQVIGIVTSSIDGGATNYALPIRAVEKIHKDFLRFGEPKYGWVGVRVKEATSRDHGSTAEIAELAYSTPAESADLKPGDIILRVGKTKVTCPEDVLDASFFLTANDLTPVEIFRNGKIKTVQVITVPHPGSCTRTLHAEAGFDSLSFRR